jgi:hypothetical protein
MRKMLAMRQGVGSHRPQPIGQPEGFRVDRAMIAINGAARPKHSHAARATDETTSRGDNSTCRQDRTGRST